MTDLKNISSSPNGRAKLCFNLPANKSFFNRHVKALTLISIIFFVGIVVSVISSGTGSELGATVMVPPPSCSSFCASTGTAYNANNCVNGIRKTTVCATDQRCQMQGSKAVCISTNDSNSQNPPPMQPDVRSWPSVDPNTPPDVIAPPTNNGPEPTIIYLQRPVCQYGECDSSKLVSSCSCVTIKNGRCNQWTFESCINGCVNPIMCPASSTGCDDTNGCISYQENANTTADGTAFVSPSTSSESQGDQWTQATIEPSEPAAAFPIDTSSPTSNATTSQLVWSTVVSFFKLIVSVIVQIFKFIAGIFIYIFGYKPIEFK